MWSGVEASLLHTFLTSCRFQVTPTTAEELVGETFNPTGYMYKMSLNISLIGLLLGIVCGCVYEVMRRKKKKIKVKPEGNCTSTTT
jgi:hypothetical protein